MPVWCTFDQAASFAFRERMLGSPSKQAVHGSCWSFTAVAQNLGKQLCMSHDPMQVAPADLEPAAALVQGPGLLGGQAGSELGFKVVPRDGYGNNWTQGPASLLAMASLQPQGSERQARSVAVPLVVASQADGSYSLSYTSQQVNHPT